ncbi:MAG: class A beta-lactamase [Gemmatimonadota bacterium]|nr:class A beta-lactamase [Gemmatimonadota bacterium]
MRLGHSHRDRARGASRFLGVALAAHALPSTAVAQSPAAAPIACAVPDSVRTALAGIARRVGGEMGIAAVHVESGARLSLNGDRRFPMASVSKVPMALEFLRRVDAGEIDPSDTLVVGPRDFRPGHSPLAAWSGGRPVRVTVDSLFTLMLGVSDNTATDVLLALAGGPSAATRRVRELGVTGVEVDRSEARTFADLVGLPDSIPESELYRYQYFRMRDALPHDYREAARERYGTDPRDTATPNGMTTLLERIHEGAGLSDGSREWLLDVMADSRSGRRRLKGLLPDSTVVAHKTGTMAGAINDVGIITLPDGAGHLIVSAFVNTLRTSTRRRERTIAEAARLLHDYFAERYRGVGYAMGWTGFGACQA